MSPWAVEAPNQSASGSPASVTSGGAPGGESRLNQPQSGLRRVPRWLRIVPYFLSALLYLSGAFTVFSPTPLLILALLHHPAIAVLGVVTNAVLIYFIAGTTNLAFYSVFVIALSVGLAIGMRKRTSIERLVLGTLACMALVALGWLWIQSIGRHHSLLQELKTQVNVLVDYVLNSLSTEAREGWLSGQSPEQWRRSFIVELPSVAMVLSLVMTLANLLIVLRLNPNGLRERMGLEPHWYRKWKSPEWLVFPAIGVGATLLLRDKVPYLWAQDISANALKVFMAIYALQGLSILSFVFEAWRIRSILRTAGYLIAVLLMMPLVLSLGFFDLWFDFRGKLRQS